MNFFAWIRDGVRRAVLLGVTDAVEDLGTPGDGDDISHHLLEVLRNPHPALVNETPQEPAKRKKLGRTLEQIQAGLAKAS
ncbi:MAG: hypothetical protein ABSG68_15300 [Thermoguttaceae bacterium]